MRAVAVLLVVAFHAGLPFVPGGYVGVDVFFVLSGFLITGLLVDELRRSGGLSFSGFYARRVRRLLPMAALVLTATVTAAHLLVPPVDRAGVGTDVASAALWGANWHFAVAGAQYMADVHKSPVLHFWSLSVEEQFYLVWPLLVLALAGSWRVLHRSWSGSLRRLGLGLAAIGAVSLLLSWQVTGTDASMAYYGLHTRAWELAAGAGVALARPLLPRVPRRLAVVGGWLGLAMVVGSAAVLDRETPFPGTAALWPVLGTALLVATGVRASQVGAARLLDRPVPRFIGRISYGWYLWHWPCIVLANARWGSPTDGGAADATTAPHAGALVLVAAVAVSFVLAVASHYVVEQPLRQARWFVRSRPRSLQLGAVAVASSLLCAWTLRSTPATSTSVAAVTTAGAPVPDQPVHMTAPTARADRPEPIDGCYLGYASTSVATASHCRYGPPHGKRTLVLIGDSHAAQWEPAMEQIADREGWTVYFFGKVACSVIDTPVWLTQDNGAYAECAEWRRRVLERVSQIRDVDAVVIGRWAEYRRLALAPDGSRAKDPALFGRLWEQGTGRTVDALGQRVPRVIVLRDTPKAAEDVPSCLSEHARQPTECAFRTDDAAHRDGALVAAEKRGGGSRLRSIDLTDVICPSTTCQVVTPDGTVKYRDEHHLSAAYASTLWQALAERLRRQLPTGGRAD
jgi:peptidoglycan/LPS O-acetylase OafA/YrhL